jgi:hypothetical protein
MAKREMTWTDVRNLLEREIDKHGSATSFAEHHGLTKQYVSQVLWRQRPPSEKLCAVLGIRADGMRWVKG